MREQCKCGRMYVAPVGNPSSKILIAFDAPDFGDIKVGRLLQGRSSDVMKAELSRVGLVMTRLRFASLWKHLKAKACTEMDSHLNDLVKEFKGKTHILLMGNDISMAVANVNSGAYQGLRVDVPGIPAEVWIAPSLSSVFGSTVGELRFALNNFADATRKKVK
jgi:hypothetical protein